MDIEGKEIDFNRILAKDALKVKSLLTLQASENSTLKEKMEADEIINSLALKYLKIKVNGEWVENCNEDFINTAFENELIVIEIIAQFHKRLEHFLALLPSFQSTKAKKKISQFEQFEDSLVVGLVSFGHGTWRQVMEMDIEDAVNTFCIDYINRFNENLAIEENQR